MWTLFDETERRIQAFKSKKMVKNRIMRKFTQVGIDTDREGHKEKLVFTRPAKLWQII